MIDASTKAAIGRLEVKWPHAGTSRGMAFLVSPNYLLTAFHVVGDRPVSLANRSLVLSGEIAFFPGDEGNGIKARAVADCADPRGDWALLELAQSIDGIAPLPLADLASLTDHKSERRFTSWGFPLVAAAARSGVVVDGRVRDWQADYQDSPAIELHADFSSGAGHVLNGLSGAPCLVDGGVVGIIRANLSAPLLKGSEHSVVGATVYACPISLLYDRCWDRIPPPDPVWGLPGIPRPKSLPPRPFRDLHRYEEDHACLYTGRGAEIRELYQHLHAAAVTFLYGQTGVGKSSLLHAGLLPRIRHGFRVFLVTRSLDETLGVTLRKAIESSTSNPDQRPPLFLLDQLESIFTDNREGPEKELLNLFEVISEQIDPSTPNKFLMGFRAEWLADVLTATRDVGVNAAHMHLRPIGERGIREVVASVRQPELRRAYNMQLDDELPGQVASWLARDPTAPISPLLSIVMTRLWEKAEQRDPRKLLLDDFKELVRSQLDLSAFLDSQLARVHAAHAQAVDSGLVLDLLYSLTTEQGTARSATKEELTRMYGHAIPLGQIDVLLLALASNSLAYPYKDGDVKVWRLAHDTLALPVRKALSQSVKPGQRARRLIESQRFVPGDLANRVLDSATFRAIVSGRSGMRSLDEEEAKLVSRTVRGQRRRRGVALGLTVAALFGLGALVVDFVERSATRLSVRGLELISEGRPQDGVPLVRLAYELAPKATEDQILAASYVLRGITQVRRPVGASRVSRPWVTFDRDFKTIAVVTNGGSRVYRLLESTEVQDSPFPPTAVHPSVSLDGRCVAAFGARASGEEAPSEHMKLMVAAVATDPCAEAGEITVPFTEAIGAIAWGNDLLYAGSVKGRLAMWKWTGPKEKWRLISDTSLGCSGCSIMKLAVSRASDTLAIGTFEGEVWVGKLASLAGTNPSLRSRALTLPIVNHLSIDDTGSRVVVVRNNDRPRIWDEKDGWREVPAVGQSSSSGTAAAFSEDGAYVAIASWDGQVSIWDAKTLERVVASLPMQQRQGDPILAMSFKGGGKDLAVFTANGNVRQYAPFKYPVYPRGVGAGKIMASTAYVDPGLVSIKENGVELPFYQFKADARGWIPVSESSRLIRPMPPRPVPLNRPSEAQIYKDLGLDKTTSRTRLARAKENKVAAINFDTGEIFGKVSSGRPWQTPPVAFGVADIEYGPDGSWIIGAQGESVRFFDSSTGSPMGPILKTGSTNAVQRVAVSDDGNSVFAISEVEAAVWPAPLVAISDFLAIKAPAPSREEVNRAVGSALVGNALVYLGTALHR